MNRWISLLTLLGLLSTYTNAQCTFETDFSSSSGWTQVGTDVSINNGNLEFLSANSGEQRRVYRSLNTPLTGSDTWKIELEFTPTGLGTWSGQPAAGHYLIALTSGTQEPLSDCPNVACTGFPGGTQDAVMVNFLNRNPPDGNINFQILHRQTGNELASAEIPFLGLNRTYHLAFERLGPNDYQLEVFSNAARTNHIAGSPVTLNVPSSIASLATIQHGAIARGNALRELSGSIDGLCVRVNPDLVQRDLPALPKAYLVLFGLLLMGMVVFISQKRL